MIFRRDAKVGLISRVPLFATCSQPELARVAGIMTQLDEPEGKVLIREGEPGRDFFVLAEGTAEVRKGNRRVKTLGPGDFVGEIALLTDAPRTATVRTTSPVSVLRVTSKGFAELLETSPTIQRKIRKALADRVAPTVL
ncbi:MAG TPA: cyclic nucleotide-binding domain-containing protein [Gaiella sp.]|uniref:cyclic nucleotide-binding domain-containing protein n=1 Tax=Gaiella sp. TaxID=2663207 RepID=UPI002D8095F9|nr:cyclic nucleotide-binding domain-containing protein [Gaiella sp.]HET9287063.1 cyclic nucleotide-binding domain-containing protein [Gaiella sp.]